METQTPTPSKRFRIKKNGEISEYDQKKYNKTWYELHKNEVLKQRIECPCGLSHLFSNKSNHRSGKVHQLWVRMNAKLEGGEKAFLGKGFGSLIPKTIIEPIDLVEIEVIEDVSPPLVLNTNLHYSTFGKMIVLNSA
jgi:hypothetical protein